MAKKKQPARKKQPTRKKRDERPRVGKQPPQYKFFLNPYVDVRFTTSCPRCSGRTKQRKLPLAIHFQQWGLVALNKTCRYCPYCDLLIAHQDELEAQFVQLFERIAPQVVGNEYLVMGTLERQAWQRGVTEPLSPEEMLEALHDFKDYLHFDPPQRWVYTGPPS